MNEKPMEWMAVCGEGMGHKLGRIVSLAAAVACFLFFVCDLVFLDADPCICGI